MKTKIFNHHTPAVYMLLLHRQTKRQSFPTIQSIADMIGCGRRTIYRSLAELKEAGFITSSRRCRESNFYIVSKAGKKAIKSKNT